MNTEDRVRWQIGHLIIANIDLSNQLAEAKKKIEELEAQLKAKE